MMSSTVHDVPGTALADPIWFCVPCQRYDRFADGLRQDCWLSALADGLNLEQRVTTLEFRVESTGASRSGVNLSSSSQSSGDLYA